MVISFSGMDASGKTTQITMAMKLFKQKEISIRPIWVRPYNTPFFSVVHWLKRMNSKLHKKPKHSDIKQSPAVAPEIREIPFIAENNEQYPNVFCGGGIRQRLIYLKICFVLLDVVLYVRSQIIGKNYILLDRDFNDALIDIHIQYPDYDFEKWRFVALLKRLFPKTDLSVLSVVDEKTQTERLLRRGEKALSYTEFSARNEYYNLYIQQNRWDLIIDGSDTVKCIEKTLHSHFSSLMQ